MSTAERPVLRAQDYYPLLERIAGYRYFNLWFKGIRYIEKGEFISEGYMGLHRALETFDPEKSPDFERYAIYLINKAITHFLREKRLVPRKKLALLKRMKKQIIRLEQQHGRKPYDTELAKALGFSLQELRDLQRYDIKIISMDREDGKNDHLPLSGRLASAKGDPVDSFELIHDMEHCLNRALIPVERQVLLLIDLQGFSGPEVVDIVDRGADLQRIHYLKRRARARMLKCLEYTKQRRIVRISEQTESGV